MNNFQELEKEFKAPPKIRRRVSKNLDTWRSVGKVFDFYLGNFGSVFSSWMKTVDTTTNTSLKLEIEQQQLKSEDTPNNDIEDTAKGRK